ncbi:MAG: TlpA disulfide reductase family protein [Elusimicrobia bacterium]|nr:TlpA disulfide reductase family protein [Elusimicrobiota bacterium]
MTTKTVFKLLLLAGVAAGFACREKEKEAAPAAAANAQTVNAVVKIEKAKTADYIKKDTYFQLPALNGGKIDLKNYADRPVLIMFFSETCPYCRQAAPFLETLHKTYKERGLAVLGICIENDPGTAGRFAKDLGLTFPLAYKGMQVLRQYKAQGVPYIYLLNAEHEAFALWPGYSPQFNNSIKRAVEKNLPQPGKI